MEEGVEVAAIAVVEEVQHVVAVVTVVEATEVVISSFTTHPIGKAKNKHATTYYFTMLPLLVTFSSENTRLQNHKINGTQSPLIWKWNLSGT